MGYNETVLEKIGSMEERADARKTIWEALAGSFEREGADGVSNELERQMAEIKGKFDSLLDSLDRML